MEDGGRDTSQYGDKHVEMNIQEECISFNSAESKQLTEVEIQMRGEVGTQF